MALTDTAIRNAKPRAKPYKIYAGDGLFLLVSPSGGKWWRFKYRVSGKEKKLSLGVYPEIGLKLARERCIQARKDMEDGIDPALNRKALKFASPDDATNSFETVAREWVGTRSAIWAPSHSSKIVRRLELDVFPWIGKRPINEIRPPELLAVLRRIEKRGAGDTAHRALQNCGQIFRYAVATGRAERDFAADLRGALAPVREGHFAAITDPKAIGGLLRAIDTYTGGNDVPPANVAKMR